jgi:hypothetical protein
VRGGANVAVLGRGWRGDKDGEWRMLVGFLGEGVRQTTMQSVLKLCRDVGGCPASAIDEGRRGGRSERSDSGRVKGRQAREKERAAVLFARAEREERYVCSCALCRNLGVSTVACWPESSSSRTVLAERWNDRAVHSVRVFVT